MYTAECYDAETAKSMIVLVTEWYDLVLLLLFIYLQLKNRTYIIDTERNSC